MACGLLAQVWGSPVPAALDTLYRQANRMQLRWVDIGEEMALFAPDDADDYEALRADPDALRALLRGPADPIFGVLASVARMTCRIGLVGGPLICAHVWPHLALTSRLPCDPLLTARGREEAGELSVKTRISADSRNS